MLASALPVDVSSNRTDNRSHTVDSQREANDSTSHRSETRSGERPTDTMTTRNSLPSISTTMTLDNRTAIFVDLGNDVQVRHAECIMGASYLTSPHVAIMSRDVARRHMASLAESGWTTGVAPWIDYTTATVNSITLRHLPGDENATKRRVLRSTLLCAGINDALDMVRDMPALVGELALYALANNLAN